PLAANSTIEPIRTGNRVEPSLGGSQAAARQQLVAPVATARAEPALSATREVELEAIEPNTSEAEGAIERAIETLDREARGEPTAELPEPAQLAAERMFAAPPRDDADSADDSGFAPAVVTPRSGAGLTIFLIVF